MRTISHSATSLKSSKNGNSRSLLNFSDSEIDSPARRRLTKAWLRSLPKSSQDLYRSFGSLLIAFITIWSSSGGRSGRRVAGQGGTADRKSTRLNSSHGYISYAVF